MQYQMKKDDNMKIQDISRRKFIQNAALTTLGIAALKSKIFAAVAEQTGLKEVFKNDFYLGTAINTGTFLRNDTEMLDLIAREFNAITPANALKWGPVNPEENKWRFQVPDQFVDFGTKNNMYIQGHVLVWHSQVPRNLFVDDSGKQVNKTVLLKRMENHISTLVDRYKGRINGWDVVNESITPEGFRKSKWFEIIGAEFMERAFHLAHEADPSARLLYNDYNMDNPKRRDFVVDLVNQYKKKGVPITGIGMQGHVGLDYPDLAEFEASIEAFAATGMRVHITELDVDVLPRAGKRTSDVSASADYQKKLNPYVNGLPKEMEDKLARRYADLFKLFLKHRDKIDRVTFWGTSDDESWKNNFPVRGRTNYPLLFDRNHQRKKAYFAVTALKG